MPGLEMLVVEHPPSRVSTLKRRGATEVHRKSTFLRGITDNKRGVHSRCFRDTLAIFNRISIRVWVIVAIIISITISTVSIASSTRSYGAVGVLIIVIITVAGGVLIIVIITVAGAMRARCAAFLGLGFKLFRFQLFRICENWVKSSGFGISTGSNNSSGITNMDIGHGVHKLIRIDVARLARLTSSLRSDLLRTSLGLGSGLLVRVVVGVIRVAIARSRLHSNRNRWVLEARRTSCSSSNRNSDRIRSDRFGRTSCSNRSRSERTGIRSGTSGGRAGTTLRTSRDDRRGLEGLGDSLGTGHGVMIWE